jgi:hypothetical protein
MSIIEGHRRRRVFAMVQDESKRSAAEFIGEARPVTFDAVPAANSGKGLPHTRMPIKDSAPGVEAKRLDVVCAHTSLSPFE